jgi:iron transport multicopper oxidase
MCATLYSQCDGSEFSGEAYILTANQLGGFKQGPMGTDAVLRTITAAKSVFGGAG